MRWVFTAVVYWAMLAFFMFQLVVGWMIGREAGFMLYSIVGLFPLLILGFPWFFWLMPAGDLDLTFRAFSASSLPWRYQGAALLSLLINATIIVGLVHLPRLFRRRS